LLVGHPTVKEAAAIGYPDELSGERLWVYVVLNDGVAPSADLSAELTRLVGEALGGSFRPKAVWFVTALPKTRTLKVMRRAIRALAIGVDPGDMSSIDDPAALDAIRNATGAPTRPN
ncbi:MAG TPA: acetyl-coenzyme A synthetase, partial [Ilumatobacteraceae bacterium]